MHFDHLVIRNKSTIKNKNFISWRKRKNVRRTEKSHSRATPLGASADEKPIQRAESKNAAPNSRRRDPRKGLSLGEERRGSKRFGGTVMFYRAKSGITNKSVSGNRGAYFLSRSAHLLTTDKVGGVLTAAVVRSTRFCFGTSYRNGKFALAA